MIRNEAEYKEAVKRIGEETHRLDEPIKTLEGMGLTKEQIKLAIDPIRSFHLQLKEEVASYERLLRREFDEAQKLRGFSHLLISLRIARGMSQWELASRLEVHESQVSRDERNEYRGITLERFARILDILGFTLRTTVENLEETQLATSCCLHDNSGPTF